MDKLSGYQPEVTSLWWAAMRLLDCPLAIVTLHPCSHQWHLNSVRCKRQYLGGNISNRAHVGRESLYVWQGVGAFLEVGEKETVGQF